jgi:predicted transcriptional regulator
MSRLPPAGSAVNAVRKRKRVGRPPAGARTGEKVTDYPQLSVRLPPDAVHRLQALSVVSRQPQWRLITDAIQCLIDRQSEADRRMVEQIATRRVAKPPRPAEARSAKAEARSAKGDARSAKAGTSSRRSARRERGSAQREGGRRR